LDVNRWAVALVSVIVVAGCTGGRTRSAAPTTAPQATVITAGSLPSPFPVAALGCSAGHLNPVIVHALFEIPGRASSATLWALAFADHPFVAAREVKIAWRMTGVGPLHLSATNLDTRQTVAPLYGAEPHTSSSWHRPGDEWGSVWVFPAQGCWRITAARSIGTGSITVTVTQPPE
jgi:hypothetical protein